MSSFYSLVKRIGETGFTESRLILKLRIVRKYTLPTFGNAHQIRTHEIVCHDRSGDRIHGTVRLPDFSRLNKVNFSEGQLVAVQYVVVENNNMKFKTTPFKFKFITSSKSRIVNIEEEDFPYYQFKFQALGDLVDPSKINQGLLLGMYFYSMLLLFFELYKYFIVFYQNIYNKHTFVFMQM